MTKTYSIDATEVQVNPDSGRSVSLSFDANESDVIGLVSIKDFIDHHGVGSVLDEIDVDDIKEHFGLIDG
jgi:hypothetical protein